MEIRDKVIESVVKKIINRSDVGYKKYGVTLHKDEQPLDTWPASHRVHLNQRKRHSQ